uniref:Uncharacterized protein n=1 Tax=Chelonoidis abingdonii TaxID=106734 RepID=A0A8C0GGR6_CHEAB
MVGEKMIRSSSPIPCTRGRTKYYLINYRKRIITYYILEKFLACTEAHQGKLGQFVYLPCQQVWPIAAPTGLGSPSQANGGSGKLLLAHPSPMPLPAVPIGQWEPRSAEPADVAGKQTGLLIQYLLKIKDA